MKDVSYLLAGVLFGLILEYVNVNANMGYVYGRFGVMFGHTPNDIPLCIGVGWGIIMYTARLFTDRLGVSLWACAALDAVLALGVDFSMDTVAYRLHMWTWDWSGTGLHPLRAQWFGIPYGNFSGWLYVVFFYSSISRLLERGLTKNKKGSTVKLALIPLASVVLSQVALYVTLVYIGNFLRSHGVTDGYRLIAFLGMLILIVAIGWRRRRPISFTWPFITWLVPAWFHLYFFLWLFLGGFYAESRWLIIAGAANLIFWTVVHLRDKRTAPRLQAQPV